MAALTKLLESKTIITDQLLEYQITIKRQLRLEDFK